MISIVFRIPRITTTKEETFVQMWVCYWKKLGENVSAWSWWKSRENTFSGMRWIIMSLHLTRQKEKTKTIKYKMCDLTMFRQKYFNDILSHLFLMIWVIGMLVYCQYQMLCTLLLKYSCWVFCSAMLSVV